MNALPNVGDLARVVRLCDCGRTDFYIGKFLRVGLITDDGAICGSCGNQVDGDCMTFEGAAEGQVYPRAWLRRVPPLSHLESTDTPAVQPREKVAA